MEYIDNTWGVYGELNNYSSTRVVICNGSIHKKLNYNIPAIPVEIALNPEKLRKLDIKNKKLAVFGNSHSGILILKNLYDLSCNHVTNIIKTSIKIPYMDENNIEIYQESGIRGVGLEWANKFMVPENKTNIKIIRSQTKLPLIIDAGLGQASDAAIAMELGCDGVLANTAIAKAKKPFQMALAFKNGVIAGRQSYLAGRIGKTIYGSASSPKIGII